VAQLFGPWSNLWPVYSVIHPALPYVVWGYALMALAVIGVVAWPRLRRDPVARFGGLGMALAVLPGCAGVTQDRVLALAGIGAMAVAASVVGAFVDGLDRARAKPWRRRCETAPLSSLVSRFLPSSSDSARPPECGHRAS